MSKLRCLCDHIIVDQSDNLPYKAYFVPDEDIDNDVDLFVAQLTALLTAHERGEPKTSSHGQPENDYPLDEDTQDALYAAIGGMIYRSGRLVYECENCGRVWVQKHEEYDKNVFACYVPEGKERGVFRSQHPRKKESQNDS